MWGKQGKLRVYSKNYGTKLVESTATHTEYIYGNAEWEDPNNMK